MEFFFHSGWSLGDHNSSVAIVDFGVWNTNLCTACHDVLSSKLAYIPSANDGISCRCQVRFLDGNMLLTASVNDTA